MVILAFFGLRAGLFGALQRAARGGRPVRAAARGNRAQRRGISVSLYPVRFVNFRLRLGGIQRQSARLSWRRAG